MTRHVRARYERTRTRTRSQARAALAIPVAPATTRDSSGIDVITQAINDAFAAAEFGVTRRPQLALVAGGQS